MARSRHARIGVAGLQPAQVLAGLVGLVFLVFGIIGLVRTGFVGFADHDHATLLGFAINPLHNLVHLVIGLLGVLMATRSGTARTFGWLLLIAYGAVFLWGLAIAGVFSMNPVSGLGNPLNLNTADNWLHGVSALVGLLIAVMPARKVAQVPEADTGVAESPARADTVTEPVPAADTADEQARPQRKGRWHLRPH
ncbi:DUF4383 domain-containing protein [Amycolatopsis suaedae]|uniref:DUF4383 domain-containing protein n=1 Tax=Amycolatopsis suaedae TaxID=2510978 RepID=A0A4Q7J871_9PSEU|nr:DUF4383 domain-containing protein [Amycolatopsis suaedae]RZQ63158.1 DUF4383 domain-containing protein [Amycolatopsis suaedae]